MKLLERPFRAQSTAPRKWKVVMAIFPEVSLNVCRTVMDTEHTQLCTERLSASLTEMIQVHITP